MEGWTPGQYLNLITSEGVIRSYSIANVPGDDGYIEIHIKLLSNGKMSQWAKTTAKQGVSVNLRSPAGDCFYTNAKLEKFSMILAGTGTGIAPLFAIARDAIKKNHCGKIIIIHGGIKSQDLYLNDEIKLLVDKHKDIIYKSCVLDNGYNIDAALKETLTDESNAKVYVCGPPETTKKLKMTAFLNGVASSNIYSDAFLY